MSRLRSRAATDSFSEYRPLKRERELVTTESKDEVLVYDKRVHHIHHLKTTVSTVWNLCDGKRTTAQIAEELSISVEKVQVSLRLLDDARLLAQPLPDQVHGTESRRQILKKAGILAIPAIISVSAPKAAAAASYPDPGGDSCYKNSHCSFPYTCDYVPEMGETAGNCVNW